jgi:adenylate cyclase
MPNIYGKYTDTIRESLINGRKRGTISKAENYSNFSGPIGSIDNALRLQNETQDRSLFESLQMINAGKVAKYSEKLGAHPDFSYLRNSNSVEYHYITSMFIDIKNSTGLFKLYEPVTVANITTTIQKAAIHTCWYFDGFVQRLHGDGLFVYFGGKNMTMQQSVGNAINAASYLTYFIQNDLKNLFSEQGIEDINIRIGIDTGKAEDVLWHLAGIQDCSEITTCSLHTSLAYKMQTTAENNGIMLGDNVKSNALLTPELFRIKKDGSGKEERYIFQIPSENFHYTQWQFDWQSYLKKNPLLANSDSKPIESGRKLNIDFLKENVKDYRPYFK